MGMASDVLSTFSRKPIFGYRSMAYAMISIALPVLDRLGPPHVPERHEPCPGHVVHDHHHGHRGALGHQDLQLAWHPLGRHDPLHHTDAQRPGVRGHVRHRRPERDLHGLTPVDIFIHDTYFIVAHIHYVVFGGIIFGIFAAIYYWFPKMFGRMMNETLGKIHSGPDLHLLQLHLLPHALSSGSAGICGGSTTRRSTSSCSPCSPSTVFITDERHHPGARRRSSSSELLREPVRGQRAERNPWQANTLEWVGAVPAAARQLRGAFRRSIVAPTSIARPRSPRITCPRTGALAVTSGSGKRRH